LSFKEKTYNGNILTYSFINDNKWKVSIFGCCQPYGSPRQSSTFGFCRPKTTAQKNQKSLIQSRRTWRSRLIINMRINRIINQLKTVKNEENYQNNNESHLIDDFKFNTKHSNNCSN
jgi:hypothetical protein